MTKLDDAIAELKRTTSSGSKMVANYGDDPSKWPSGHWRNAMEDIIAVRDSNPTPAPTPTPTPTSDFYSLVTALQPPAMVVQRHIICTTEAEHDAAWAAIQPGDWIECRGITFTGLTSYQNKNLTSYAMITYNSACSFHNTAGSAFYTNNCSYIQWVFNPVPSNWITYAGLAACVATTSQAGYSYHGYYVNNCHHCVFDGWYAEDCGGDGLAAFPTLGPIHDCFFRGEANRCAVNVAGDNHLEKGTGVHGMNLGDSTKFSAYNNIVAIYGHDMGNAAKTMGGGAALEIGDANSSTPDYDNKLYVKAHNMNYPSTVQVGGNGVNAQGYQHDNEFVIVEASNCQGRAFDVNAAKDPFTNIKVSRGTAVNCCLNPHINEPDPTNPWDKRHNVIYGEVSPTP